MTTLLIALLVGGLVWYFWKNSNRQSEVAEEYLAQTLDERALKAGQRYSRRNPMKHPYMIEGVRKLRAAQTQREYEEVFQYFKECPVPEELLTPEEVKTRTRLLGVMMDLGIGTTRDRARAFEILTDQCADTTLEYVPKFVPKPLLLRSRNLKWLGTFHWSIPTVQKQLQYFLIGGIIGKVIGTFLAGSSMLVIPFAILGLAKAHAIRISRSTL